MEAGFYGGKVRAVFFFFFFFHEVEQRIRRLVPECLTAILELVGDPVDATI